MIIKYVLTPVSGESHGFTWPVMESFITVSDSRFFVMSRSCQAFDLRLDKCTEFLRILDYILLAADIIIC